MNHPQLQQELRHTLHGWCDTERQDAARLRRYQRALLDARRAPVRPRVSIQILLNQCATARRQARQSRAAILGCQARLKQLADQSLSLYRR